VPAAEPRPPCFAHPRLRRASPITQYAAAAALEAAGDLLAASPTTRFGLIFCLQSGPVQYATRFFGEVVKDPATASPLLFPETVFSAPASHIAALLGTVPISYTIIGDPSAFLEGIAIGAAWLVEKRVDACLVVGAEEFNWLQAQAVWHFDHHAILGAGAGALCLTPSPFPNPNLNLNPNLPPPVELSLITDPATYSESAGMTVAAREVRSQIPAATATDLLVDGLGGTCQPGKAETAAWRDWPGARLSPKRILGEGLMAASAWQCVLAVDAIRSGRHPAATASVIGFNQQALAARFARPTT
jgi:3-oxoacyl-(acyl-carrier-protein) synthase